MSEQGKTETAEEKTERLAEASRKYRAHKTINNLWLSLIACVAVVAVIVVSVPRNDSPRITSLDYRSVAEKASGTLPMTLAVPDVPADWICNAAEIRSGTDSVPSWYVGFITGSQQFIALTQTAQANPRWLAAELKNSTASATTDIGGMSWTIYDNRLAKTDVGNVKYALVAEKGSNTYLLFGTAERTEFEQLAAQVSKTVFAENFSSQPERIS